MLKRISATLVLMMVLIVNVACSGPLGRLNDILPFVPSTIDTLVVTGAFDEATGNVIKNDFNDGLAAVRRAEDKLKAGEPKAAVYSALANEWRLIVARNHFAAANSPKVNAIAGLVTGIVEILARKYNQPAGVRATTDYDKQLKEKIDQLEREVKNK